MKNAREKKKTGGTGLMTSEREKKKESNAGNKTIV